MPHDTRASPPSTPTIHLANVHRVDNTVIFLSVPITLHYFKQIWEVFSHTVDFMTYGNKDNFRCPYTAVTYHSHNSPGGRGRRTKLWQTAVETEEDRDLEDWKNMTRVSKQMLPSVILLNDGRECC